MSAGGERPNGSQICVEITKIFDQCLIQDCKDFSVCVPDKDARLWEPVACEIKPSSQQCGGTITMLGGPNFRTVNWFASGEVRAILRRIGTTEEELDQVPFSFTGSALLWAPDPHRMFVKCELVARCLNVTVSPAQYGLTVTVTVGICLVVKTASDMQFAITEPPLCPVPPPCPPPGDPCTDFTNTPCPPGEFTIPQKP